MISSVVLFGLSVSRFDNNHQGSTVNYLDLSEEIFVPFVDVFLFLFLIKFKNKITFILARMCHIIKITEPL